jgi:hypothetical protein
LDSDSNSHKYANGHTDRSTLTDPNNAISHIYEYLTPHTVIDPYTDADIHADRHTNTVSIPCGDL